MTRVIVLTEGVDSFHNGTLVAPGALKLPDNWGPDKPVPVVVNFVPSMIVAKATQMERSAEGAISFELEWLTPRFEKIYSDWDLSFYTQPVVEAFDNELGRRVATRATIRGLSYFDPTSDDVGRSLPL